MISAQLLRNDGILVVSPTDKLESEDFERLKILANPYLEEHGNLNGLLIDAEEFPGWEDFSSLLSHIDFIRNYRDKIKRVATVSDSSFLAILPKLADYFVAAEIQHFDYSNRDKAINWLRTGMHLP